MLDVAVKVLVLSGDGKSILLVLEKEERKYAGDRRFIKPSMWGFPGGCMDFRDEDEIATAYREVEEEAGIVVEIESNLRVEEHFDGYTKILLLGREAGGQLKAETEETYCSAWVPYCVLFDRATREEWCPEGIYSSHIRVGQLLLRRFWVQTKNAKKEKPQPIEDYSPVEYSLPVDKNLSMACMTDEEAAKAAFGNRMVYYRSAGKIYAGFLYPFAEDGFYWFQGRSRCGALFTEKVQARDLYFLRGKKRAS